MCPILSAVARLALFLGAVWCVGCTEEPPAATLPGEDGVRIVAISPALAVMLRDLGYEESIVGRHGYDCGVASSAPVCGDQAGLDLEAIIRAEPTHVLTEWGSRDLPERFVRLARQHGWVIRDFGILTLEDIAAASDALRRTFPPRDGGADQPFLDRLGSSRADLARLGPVLMLHNASPPMGLGPGSCHHELLVRLGARPALKKGRPSHLMNVEDVLRLSPEVIVLFVPRSPGTPEAARDAERVKAMLGPIARLDIPAIKHSRVAVIDHPLGLLPSTSLAEVSRELADVLEGWTHRE